MTKGTLNLLAASIAIGLSIAEVNAGDARLLSTTTQHRVVKAERSELLSHNAKETSLRVRKLAKPVKAKRSIRHAAPISRGEASNIIYSCSFDFMSEGSEAVPAPYELDDWDNIPEEVIGEENYGFGGQGLMQAGGAVYIPFEYNVDPDDEYGWFEYGLLWTPDIYEPMTVTIELDAKIPDGSDYDSDELWVFASDYNRNFAEDYDEIDKTWKHFTLTLDASAFAPESEDDSFYFSIFTDIGADMVIKNLVIKGEETPLRVPVAGDYTNYTGTSFTANWMEVEGATGYYLSVFEYNAETDVTTATFLDKQFTEETHYDVTGLSAGKFYAYNVCATDGSYTTAASNMVKVCELAQGSGLTLTPSSDFKVLNASWTSTPGANYYVVTGNMSRKVTAGENIVLANADFSGIESTGTVSDPLESEYWYESVAELPGWEFSLACSAEGAFGFMDNAYYTMVTGLSASLSSLDYDLSNISEGTAHVSIDVASPGNGMLAGMLTYDESQGKYVVASVYGTADVIPQEYTNYSFDLTGGSDKSQFVFMTKTDDYADGTILIRKLSITATADKDGNIVMPLSSIETERTLGEFEVSLESGVEYTVTVTPYLVDDYGYVIAMGKPSEPVTYICPTSGIALPEVVTDANEVRYFNLQGQSVSNPVKGTLLIKVSDNGAMKVVN